ncbi:MAG: PAS domain-containing protein [Lentisphaerae bacterium]|nr:PAS domain-containing protein [Lentisphaerota bacterium]
MQLDASNQQLLAEENQLKTMNLELAASERALLETRANYQHITANVPGIVFQYLAQPDGRRAFLYFSPKSEAMLASAPDLIQRNPDTFFQLVHEHDRESMTHSWREATRRLSIWNWVGRMVVNGQTKWFHGVAQPERRTDQSVLWDGLLIDISDRRQAEQELVHSRHMLRLVLDSIPTRVFWKNLAKEYLGCNRAFADDAGLAAPEDIVGCNDHDMPWVDQAELYRADDQQVIDTRKPKLNIIEPQSRTDKPAAWLRTNKIPLIDADGILIGVLGSYEDITEQRAAEDRIRASLQEKEVLLKEIHHRVKNNLQVISSLLNMQAEYISDPRGAQIFKESQLRVRAMSMVHERLYISPDLSNVNFGEYLHNITGELIQFYRRPDVKLQIETEPVMLTVSRATPCGLLVHELVTNSLKYAFSGQPAGGQPHIIRISMQTAPNDHWRLVVADNGIGLPSGINPQKTKTLGLQLATILTRQIQGQLTLKPEPGTVFEIIFPKRG